MRGTFANIRLRHLLAREPRRVDDLPSGRRKNDDLRRGDAVRRGRDPSGHPRRKEYGSGSSRDWGGQGPRLLGCRAVIAESFERIHRSNLVGMGILPLQFVTAPPGNPSA